jgi:carboxypeptidase family protein/TonB-dependent receptor-like protein
VRFTRARCSNLNQAVEMRSMSDTPFRARLLGRLVRLLVIIGIWTLALARSSSAQTGTTGAVAGKLLNQEGAIVAGAQVTARSTETGLTRSAVSTAAGTYIVRHLPPGIYNVAVSSIGYRAEELKGLRVQLGQTTGADVRMLTEAVAIQGIVVDANRQTVDVRDGSVRQLVTQEEVEALPALGRNFTDFIALSGLVAPSPETTTGGQFTIAGQRPSQTNLRIDGADANNSFFGENRGGSRVPFTFSLESIREFQIITNGFDVELGNYAAGVVNVVTRGGTNNFEGNIYSNLRNQTLAREDFNGNAVSDYRVNQFAGRFSGPIVRDRAFFLISADGQIRREPQEPLTQQSFLDQETPDQVGFTEFARFLEILENRYGITNAGSGYQPFKTSADQITLFGRLDWLASPSHRLSIRHNFAHFVNDNLGGGGSTGLSGAETLKSSSHSFVTELQSSLGPNTFNSARIQLATESRPRDGKEVRPRLTVRDLGDSDRDVQYGGTSFALQNRMIEDKVELHNTLIHTVRDHTFKVGGTGIFTHITNQFIANGAGVYEFATLDDFENFQPARYTRNQRADGQLPLAEFNVAEWGLYLQDEWQVSPRLTATLGLRYDQQVFADRPDQVAEVERDFGVASTNAPVDRDNMSPRLALAWDARGDGSAVLRAGAGYFYGRLPYVLGGNVEQTVQPILSLTCDGLPTEADAPPSPSGYANWARDGSDNPFACAQSGQLTGLPTYNLWKENFDFPETLKANIGYEQMIGSRTRASVDFLYTSSKKLYTVRDINLLPPQFTLAGEGGRRVFIAEASYNPRNPAGEARRANRGYSNIFVNYNDGAARAYSATAELSHQLGRRTSLRASYTYTSAYDNSSYTCCTASEGFNNPSAGALGEVGSPGDTDGAWGPSDHMRNHTIVFSGLTALPLGFRVSAMWRLQSGRPWGPSVGGSLNADGRSGRDRPFIFAPEDLPLAATDPAQQQTQRALYASYLADNPCVGDYVGQIIPRNSCRQPWFNRLDMKITREFRSISDQHFDFEVDLFNVLNGIEADWGHYESVNNSRLLTANRYDQPTGRVLYDVPTGFGGTRGSSLLLQFQAQIGFRYRLR